MKSWISKIFRARQARRGNVVRRSLSSVEKHGPLSELIEAVDSMGYHMAIIGTQVVILCDPSGTIKILR
jgi:hypothetical protein